MNCCEKCFRDLEIKAIIIGENTKGVCNFCSSKNVFVTNIIKNEYLQDNFEELLNVYTHVCDIGEDYPRERSELLKNILCSKWNVFSLKPDNIYRFLVSLLPEKYTEQSKLFD
ncbi:MAG TPA: hypothetical protein GX527_07245 [Clostridiaceae bacterium]|nr:hypothetical protein [Clostridiaceae bacterium]